MKCILDCIERFSAHPTYFRYIFTQRANWNVWFGCRVSNRCKLPSKNSEIKVNFCVGINDIFLILKKKKITRILRALIGFNTHRIFKVDSKIMIAATYFHRFEAPFCGRSQMYILIDMRTTRTKITKSMPTFYK